MVHQIKKKNFGKVCVLYHIIYRIIQLTCQKASKSCVTNINLPNAAAVSRTCLYTSHNRQSKWDGAVYSCTTALNMAENISMLLLSGVFFSRKP